MASVRSQEMVRCGWRERAASAAAEREAWRSGRAVWKTSRRPRLMVSHKVFGIRYDVSADKRKDWVTLLPESSRKERE